MVRQQLESIFTASLLPNPTPPPHTHTHTHTHT